ncbi:unnamed protein product [Malus baccata var. baccata]
MSHPGLGWITSRACSTTVARYCPLWTPTMPSRTFQRVTYPGIALTQTCLTSEFRWNPKPVSSQNTSC